MQRSLFFSTLGLCAAGAVLAGNLGAQNLRAAQQISVAGAFDAAIGSSGNLSCVCWTDLSNGLFSSVSDGQGKVWGPPVQVSPDVTGRKDMRGDDVIVVDGVIYVFWTDRRSGGIQPAFAVSTDGGATWTETFNIGGLTSPQIRTWKFLANAGPTAAQGDDNIWAVIAEDATGPGTDDELFVIYSSNGGASFAANYAQPGVTQGGGTNDVDGLDAKAQGSTLYLSWCDERNGGSPIADDIWFNSTTDGGATWQHATCLNVEADAVADGETTSIAVSGTTVAIAWEQERWNQSSPEELLCAISFDGGATFGAPQVVGNYARESAPVAGDGDDVDGVSCTISSNGDVIVCYGDDRNGGNEMNAAVSTGGGPFAEVASIASGGFPTVVSGAAYDVMTFDDDGAPDDNVFAISYDNGASWDVVTQVSGGGDIDHPGDLGESVAPNAALAVNQFYHDNVISAWLDDSLGGNEVMLGGFRAPTVTVVGWNDVYNVAETTLQWQFKGYQDKGAACIVYALGNGPALTDGRTVDLDPGYLGTFSTSTLFFAGLTSGAGATPPTANFFPTIFPGTLLGVPLVLQYTGVGLAAPGPFITSDVSSFTL